MKKQYEHIIDVLMSGEAVSMVTLTEKLGAVIQMNRLSTYMWEIKKAGGLLEVLKEGKKVSGYKLMNPEKFANKPQVQASVEMPKATKELKAQKTVKAAKAKEMPAKKKSDISSCAVDGEFDAASPEEINSIIGKN